MILTAKKELFLANKENKQRFINMLSEKLQLAGCDVHHAKGDADLLIAQTALTSAESMNTVLEGEDTDLLVIYVVRNPKDVLVSLNHQINISPYRSSYESFQDILDDFMSGQTIQGEWPAHVTHWWIKKEKDNVLFLKYEDMKKDLEETVRAVCAFLGKTLTSELIQRISDECTFEAMKKRKVKDHLCKIFGIDPSLSPFIRKGKVGGWKDHFTVAQNEVFDKWYHEALEGTGLSFDFIE
ncbi:sulfotransferase 1C3-like [Saccoglossus kowalevskii]|uniref:Sulfotransferase 1C3-like n=1 Tax=Saccoglossus kowalevskii TaxID=10224 RepID=A0ABM0M5I1_SACKO|nr:PREDICTED: sulfotransferase 1C3-like [Saccoglossus kowalevskii]